MPPKQVKPDLIYLFKQNVDAYISNVITYEVIDDDFNSSTNEENISSSNSHPLFPIYDQLPIKKPLINAFKLLIIHGRVSTSSSS